MSKERKAGMKANEAKVQSNTGIRHLMSKLVKKDKLDGREMLVVPTILIREGVHNGALYTCEEIQKFPEAWNGRPVVVRHPNKDGVPVTAGQPNVLEEQTVGVLYNCHWDSKLKALKGEAWVDMEKCKLVAPEVLEKLEANQQLEVSTGLFTEDEELEVNEKWNDEEYGVKVHAFRPDHLAILPDSVGACSWEDGAGMPRINEGTSEGLVINQISHEAMREAIERKMNPTSAIQEAPTSSQSPYKYIRETFDDHAIIGCSGGKMYRQWFKKTADGIELDGEPEEVFEEKKYKAVKQNEGTSDGTVKGKQENKDKGQKEEQGSKSVKQNTTSTTIQTNSRKEQVMDRTKMVAELIAGGKWNEDDRDFLTNLEDDQFSKIHSAAIPAKANAKAEVKEEDEDMEDEEEKEEVEVKANEEQKPSAPKTLEQYVAEAPVELRSVLTRAVKRDQATKNALVKELKANSRCRFNEAELNAMDIDGLEKLATLAQVDVDYSGAVGTVAPKNNEDDEDAAPEMPALFAKK